MKPLLPLIFLAFLGAHVSQSSEAPATGSNRLAAEQSPYLLQHKDNPVDWYPWGEEAFERARELDRPIFLSIGYATCHWCHVMEHESFEDEEVAALMNETFISIKVDREERPDVDQVYMAVCQMLTGSGGWPLTIVMTPDAQPFFAGTYIPKATRLGRLGMLELIPRIEDVWRNDREKLMESAAGISAELAERQGAGAAGELPADLLGAAAAQLAQRYEPSFGGFSQTPKFPSPHNLLALLRHWRRDGDEKSLEMVDHTLESMRAGGVWDHVGYGYHRYSTDTEWLVPHFEKMLYDQALMAMALAEAWQATGKIEHRRTAEQTLEYVERDMTSQDGMFFSAEDADSEGEEGLFYVWTDTELEELLGKEEAALAKAVWATTAEGNFHDEASQEKTGRNILHRPRALDEVAKELEISEGQAAIRLEAIRKTLFEHREGRVHPLKDDKVLTDWNGLMIGAFARCGRIFDDQRLVDVAVKAADGIFEFMRPEPGVFHHRYRGGEAKEGPFLDDHAFLGFGMIELFDATGDPWHLEQARELTEEMLVLYSDPGAGGLFFTPEGGERLLVRSRDVYDGAIPSGNSVAVWNLLRLAHLRGDSELTNRAAAIAEFFARQIERSPSAHSWMAMALALEQSPAWEVVIVGEEGAEDTEAMLAAVRSAYRPEATLIHLEPKGSERMAFNTLAPYASSFSMVDGKATAYVCSTGTCKLPTTEVEKLVAVLDGE